MLDLGVLAVVASLEKIIVILLPPGCVTSLQPSDQACMVGEKYRASLGKVDYRERELEGSNELVLDWFESLGRHLKNLGAGDILARQIFAERSESELLNFSTKCPSSQRIHCLISTMQEIRHDTVVRVFIQE